MVFRWVFFSSSASLLWPCTSAFSFHFFCNRMLCAVTQLNTYTNAIFLFLRTNDGTFIWQIPWYVCVGFRYFTPLLLLLLLPFLLLLLLFRFVRIFSLPHSHNQLFVLFGRHDFCFFFSFFLSLVLSISPIRLHFSPWQ